MNKLPLAIFSFVLLLCSGPSALRAQSNKPTGSERPLAQQSPTEDKTPRSGGSISGRVIGEGGRPVADASIMTFPVSVASNMRAMVTSLFRRISSDADGKFEVTGLQPGAYRVYASAPGYVLSDSDSKPYYRPGDAVTLNLVKGAVITGKVTNSSGDPLVAVVVRAIKVREPDNKPPRKSNDFLSEIRDSMSAMLGSFKTDDRGVYRIYGLDAGYYQVAAGGGGTRGFSLGPTASYDSDAPTYFPSSTLDTAAEVTVRAGDEVTGIDIRYRDNRGHAVSGTVSGSTLPNQRGISVILTRAVSGISEAATMAEPAAKGQGFAFDALLDGEYVVTATAFSTPMLDASPAMNASVSPSRRVTVRGADVSGVELVLEPLASITGRAVIEPLQDAAKKPDCKPNRPARIEELVINSESESKRQPDDQAGGMFSMFKNSTPDDKGDFVVSPLRAGVHRLDIQLPTEHLYIKSITLPSPAPNGKRVDAAKTGVTLKSGDAVKGLVATISEGAAGLRGIVSVGAEDKPPAMKMRVYLVPVEPEAADDVLRYYEAEVSADGGFAMTNLAPGKYWLVGREVSDQEKPEAEHKPVAWDAGGRTGLRFEGEASKKVIELMQCQLVNDFRLKYVPLTKPARPLVKKESQ